MKISSALIVTAILALPAVNTAMACENHGAWPYQSSWQYDEYEQQAYDDGGYEMTDRSAPQLESADGTGSVEKIAPAAQPQPSFSSAATRASDAAKTKLRLSQTERSPGPDVAQR